MATRQIPITLPKLPAPTPPRKRKDTDPPPLQRKAYEPSNFLKQPVTRPAIPRWKGYIRRIEPAGCKVTLILHNGAPFTVVDDGYKVNGAVWVEMIGKDEYRITRAS